MSLTVKFRSFLFGGEDSQKTKLPCSRRRRKHLEGPFFLGLERRWSRSLGNDIRLYLLQLEGPTVQLLGEVNTVEMKSIP